MATAPNDARDAILTAIKVAADEIAGEENYAAFGQTGAIRDLALAWRYLANGPQPGSIEISK